MKNLYASILTSSFFDKNYIKNKKSLTQISNMTGAYRSTVKRYALSNGIKLRTLKEQAAIFSTGGSWKHDDLLTKKFFVRNYIRLKKSIKDISLETGIERSVIRRYMTKLEIPRRACHDQMHISHPPKEFKLTKDCMAFFDGLLLGDGSIPLRKGGNPRCYTQGCKHAEYLNYIISRAKKYGITFSPVLTRWRVDDRCKNKGFLESFLQSHSFETFEKIRKRWYDAKGVKHVPKDVLFNKDSLLQFYLGDGNFYREIKLCTDGFSLEEINFLQNLFDNCLKITTRVVKNGNNYEIVIKKSDTRKFLSYIGKCPIKCYEYKWQDNESEEKKLEKNKRAREIYHLKRNNYIGFSMPLNEYIKKRKWNKDGTPEPDGKELKTVKTKNLIYVIQRHSATHLHNDLRLEMDGVLKSWAIPKDPLLTLEGKRLLAVGVEDHPLSYSTFEGVIPKGQYGAGTVKIWDKGTYELIEKTEKGFVVKLNGKKLNGTYVLFKFKPPKNWLFFKKRE